MKYLLPLHASGTHVDVAGSQTAAQLWGHQQHTDSRWVARRTRLYIHVGLHEPAQVIQGVERTKQLYKGEQTEKNE